MALVPSATGTEHYLDLVRQVHERGEIVAKAVDLLDVSVKMSPTKGFVFVKKQHWIWALAELSDRLDPLGPNPGHAWYFRSNWKKKLNAEGGEFCYSYPATFAKQLPSLLKRLRKKQTREAIMNVWQEDHLLSEHPRTPCTLTLHFLRRDDVLHLFVNMRTNDIINLLPYDWLHHCSLQAYVAACLNLRVGWYYHHADHAYYQKKRAATGNIERVIDELTKTCYSTDPAVRSWPARDGGIDFGSNVEHDMRVHRSILTSARADEFSALGLDDIQSDFIRDWTIILVLAELKYRSSEIKLNIGESQLKLPLFKFIYRNSNLRRKR